LAPPEIDQNVSHKLGNLGLTDAEEDQIVQFLKTLTDGYFTPPARPEEQPVPSATSQVGGTGVEPYHACNQ
jgi:hypothetical protein